jgi:HSP20 family molecular chaperone IbpA
MLSRTTRTPLNLSRTISKVTFKPQARTMAFFPQRFHNDSSSSFTPLFRLLDDFDSYARHNGTNTNNNNGTGRHTALSSWQPKFDLRETEDAYELHGELPGLNKDNVQLEFTDPQTMFIRGKVERTYSAGTPPAGLVEGQANTRALAEGQDTASTANGHDEHQPTVEDDDATADETSEVTAPKHNTQPAAQTDKARYWLTERSIGEFSRTFTFPSRVEQEGVGASFKDGILHITVPKAKKHEARRIIIN